MRPRVTKKIQICHKCNQKIGRGIAHPCVVSNKVDNIYVLAAENNNVKEQVASTVIHEKGNKVDSEISLKNKRGRDLRVKINPKLVQKKVMSHEEMDALAMNTNLTDNKAKKTMQMYRKINGKGSIQPHYRESRAAKVKKNAEFLVNKKLKLMDSKKVVRDIDVVVMPKVDEYVEFLRETRNIAPENVHVKVGFDNGGGFYKGTLSVMDKSTNPEDKPKFGPDFKDTGVKKLSFVELAQDIKENYDNVSTLFKENNFHELDQSKLTYIGDQKMEYIATGKSGPLGKCCCYYCRVRGPLTGQEEVVELYTIGMLREHNRQFVANGSKLKDAQLYDNMIHAPLLTGPDFMLVLDQFLPPQLHLLLRSVNHIVENLQLNSQKLYGTDFVMDFVKQNAIVCQNYHGGGFEGN